jgi:hypothetical protein
LDVAVHPPWFAATHAPTFSPASGDVTTQIWPLVHCPSSVHPPQTLGVAKPHVGEPDCVEQYVSDGPEQLPATQAPLTQT